MRLAILGGTGLACVAAWVALAGTLCLAWGAARAQSVTMGTMPKEVARLEGVAIPGYAWVSTEELLIWSMDVYEKSYGHKVILVNAGTRESRDVADSEPFGAFPGFNLSFSNRIGAWLTPTFGSPACELNWMEFNGLHSHSVVIEVANALIPPVWIGSGASRRIAVAYITSSAGIRLFKPDSDTPEVAIDFKLASAEYEAGSHLRKLLGCTPEGAVVGYGEHRDLMYLVEIRITKGGCAVVRHAVDVPAGLQVEDAALSGSKVIWLMERTARRSRRAEPPRPGDFQIWSSDLDGRKLESILEVPIDASVRGSPVFKNVPGNLQARPGTSEVSYAQNGRIYTVDLRGAVMAGASHGQPPAFSAK